MGENRISLVRLDAKGRPTVVEDLGLAHVEVAGDDEPVPPNWSNFATVTVEVTYKRIDAAVYSVLFGVPLVDASILLDDHIERGRE